MKGRVFVDSNVLVYAFTEDDRSARARGLLKAEAVVWSVHVLNEFVHVARRKLSREWKEILVTLALLESVYATPAPVTAVTQRMALGIAQRYGYHIFDSLVIAAALEAECDTLYSEDMQHGQRIDGLVIRNPFRK
ncbi:MAG TPA: PIN domain-containing protein [Bryobacteraceae bacterium]|nr:PIN domain-containing protein [Bryobacteraceae bacterium]